MNQKQIDKFGWTILYFGLKSNSCDIGDSENWDALGEMIISDNDNRINVQYNFYS